MNQPETPILDRMQAAQAEPCRLVDHSNMLGAFLDWLEANGVVLARRSPEPVEVETAEGDIEFARDILVRDSRGPNRLLHDYYGIDMDAEEAERRALLDYVRALFEEREAP